MAAAPRRRVVHHEYEAKTSVASVRRREPVSVPMIVSVRVATLSLRLNSSRARSCGRAAPLPRKASSKPLWMRRGVSWTVTPSM